MELLTEAAALSPSSAPILSALACASGLAGVQLHEPGLEGRARAAVDRALATGPGEAFLASAVLRNNQADLEGGASDLGRALIRAPMSAAAHETAARLLCEVSPPADARRHFATAIALDPTRSQMIMLDLARLDVFDGDFESADRRLAEVQQDPDAAVRAVGALYDSRIASWKRDTARMLRTFDQFGDRLTGSTAATELLTSWIKGGPFEASAFHAMIAHLIHSDRPRRLQLVALQRATETLALVGQADLAIEILEQAARLGLIDIRWVDHCPLFSELRTHARWQAIRDQVAARATAVRAAFDAAR